MKRLILVMFAVGVTILSVGCATSYQTRGFTGGYTETQLAPDVFRVTFRGNGHTSAERAQDFAMLRASELALQNGYAYFGIVDERNSSAASSFTTPGQSVTTGAVANYGGQVAYSGNTVYIPGQTYTTYKPKTGIVVRLFKIKPAGIFTFDAAFLQQSIRRTYKLD